MKSSLIIFFSISCFVMKTEASTCGIAPCMISQQRVLSELKAEGYQVRESYEIESICGYSSGGSTLHWTLPYYKLVNLTGNTVMLTCETATQLKVRDGYYYNGLHGLFSLDHVSPTFDRWGKIQIKEELWFWNPYAPAPQSEFENKQIIYPSEDAYLMAEEGKGDRVEYAGSRLGNRDQCLPAVIGQYGKSIRSKLTFIPYDSKDYSSKAIALAKTCKSLNGKLFNVKYRLPESVLAPTLESKILLHLNDYHTQASSDWVSDEWGRHTITPPYFETSPTSDHGHMLPITSDFECRMPLSDDLKQCTVQKGITPIDPYAQTQGKMSLRLKDNPTRSDIDELPNRLKLSGSVVEIVNTASFTVDLSGPLAPRPLSLEVGQHLVFSVLPGGYIDIRAPAGPIHRVWFD